MSYQSGDEIVDLKLECIRIAIAGQYAPGVVMSMALDMFAWVVEADEEPIPLGDIGVAVSKMN